MGLGCRYRKVALDSAVADRKAVDSTQKDVLVGTDTTEPAKGSSGVAV
jgi:hypothetical protein